MKKQSELLKKISKLTEEKAFIEKRNNPNSCAWEILIYNYTLGEGDEVEERFYQILNEKYPKLVEKVKDGIEKTYREFPSKRTLWDYDWFKEASKEMTEKLNPLADHVNVVGYLYAWLNYYYSAGYEFEIKIDRYKQAFRNIFKYCKMNENLELKEKTITVNDQELELPKNSFFGMDEANEEEVEIPVDSKATPMVDKYSFDMTAAADEGKFDPVVGRSEELEELIRILCCRKKNNAVLLGEPGVGKTAIMEALAQNIVDKKVPKYLLGKRLVSLNLNNLVAGTKYRGQFEERLKNIIEEVIKHPELIVFIDEFHTIIGSGASEGGNDAANVLKPYLSRGQFQVIGATTEEEYRKHIEKDGALKRRFQNVRIVAPTLEEVKTILMNIKEKYEDYHGVKYSEEIIESIVNLSERYVNDRNFPDKAIDLMDLAGSITKLGCADNKEFIEKILSLEIEIKNLNEKKNQAVRNQDFSIAGDYRDQEKAKEMELDALKKGLTGGDEKTSYEVTELNVMKAISRISGVPLEKIGTSDLVKLKTMKETLEKIVIGQPEAIMEVTKALQRNSLGLRDPKKPIATLLMVGPTGSGKTYICKTLAKEFFGSESALIKFDMSEYGEKHEVTKLIGASASYVGYGDTPLLEQVRRKPYSVVLFDEIEKADKAIYQLFLSILDEGIVTLANGTKVDFKNCVIVFTGNVGTKDLILKGSAMGFGGKETEKEKKDKIDGIVKKAIEKTFAPEFINRLTKTVIFNELTKENLMSICELELVGLINRLETSGYKLTVDKAVKELIVNKCDLKYGARDLQRNIVKYIEDEVCNELLNITDTSLKKVKVSLAKKEKEDIKVKFS